MQFALDTYMEAGVGNSRVLPDVRMHGISGCLIQPVFGSQGMVGGQKKDHLVCGTGLQVHTNSAGYVVSSHFPQHQISASNEEFSIVPG